MGDTGMASKPISRGTVPSLVSNQAINIFLIGKIGAMGFVFYNYSQIQDDKEDIIAIEINPRVSRSSALASKATCDKWECKEILPSHLDWHCLPFY